MTATRDIPKVGPLTGQSHVTAVADTVNQISKYLAGNAINPSGENAIEFTIDVMAGLTGVPDGFELNMIAPNSNSGPMTLEIKGAGLGTKPLRDSAGNALNGDEIIAGTAYKFIFFGDEDHWRIVGSARSAVSGRYPLIYIKYFDTPGAWTWDAPWDCDFQVIAIGGGGSGGRNSPATGGGAGGTAIKFQAMSFGDTISGVVGNGGAANTTFATPGNDGGTTTVTSQDIAISLSASGGEGGNASTASAAGGGASGGDLNYSGGSSGSVTGAATSGGGGVGVFENGLNSASSSGTSAGLGAGNGIPSFINYSPFGTGFKGGDSSSSDDGYPGLNGGGGGATGSGSASGAGGGGLVMIQYSADKSA